MMKTFEEFKKEVCKSDNPIMNITNSVGVRQGFLFLQKRKWKDVGRPITEKQFQQIVRSVDKELSDVFIKNRILTFPLGMGTLEARSSSTKARYNSEGKLIIPKQVNWNETLKLWYTDPEAFESRILVRSNSPIKFDIVFEKSNLPINNKNFFNFYLNRTALRTISSMIRERLIETYLSDESVY